MTGLLRVCLACVVLSWIFVAVDAAENRVQNGGFEADADGDGTPDNWQAQRTKTATRVQREGGDGDWCVELIGDDPKTLPLWIQHELKLTAGATYAVAYDAWAPAGVEYRLYLEWAKTNGKYGASSLRHSGWQKGRGAWDRNVFVFPLPADANPPYIVLQLRGRGKVRFDNVLVTKPVVEPTRPGNVYNCSFETWPLMWEQDPGVSVSKVDAADGKACLCLSSTAEGNDPSATDQGIPTKPGKRYRLTYRAKAGGGSAESTGFQYFRVSTSWDRLVQDGRDFGSVSQRDGLAWQDCFANWQRRTLEFTTPAKPTSGMRITCQVRGPGTVFIDDLVLREIEEVVAPDPGVVIRVDSPSYRNSVFSTAAVNKLKATLSVTAENAARVDVELRSGADGPALQRVSRKVKTVPSELEITMPFPADRVGVHQVGAVVRDAAGKTLAKAAETVTVHAPRPVEVTVRDDLVTLYNGKPFFPVGLWRAPGSDRALHELARAGFNLVRMVPSTENLDRAQRLGIRVMGNLANDPPSEADARATWEAKSREKLDPVRDHPALFGYYLVDEPLWNGRPIQPLLEAYAFHRQCDPYRPIWLNAAPRGTVEDLATYNRACDISGADIYPVPEGGSHSELEDRTVSSVGKYSDIMRASVADRKPIWMTLQAFSWPHLTDRHAKDAVYPSVEQSRFMAYDCVLHGATGLMYWGSHYIADPAFWDVLKRTATELHGMSAVLTAETVSPSAVTTETDDMLWLHKATPGGPVVIAANEGKADQEVTFSVPFDVPLLHVWFENRTVSVSDGRFGDRFTAHAVHIYGTTPTPPVPLLPLPKTPSDLKGKMLEGMTREFLAKENYKGNASWVWYPGTSRVKDSVCFLRHTFDLGTVPASATLIVTADDEFTCMVNGQVVAADDSWSAAERVTVTDRLRKGRNVIAVDARDLGVPPAAFLCELILVDADGKRRSIVSDASWKATDEKPAEGWQSADFDDTAWPAAEEVAPYGSGPWRNRLLIAP